MGCLKLHIDSLPNLRVIHSKKKVKLSKKRGSYYPFGLKHKGYNYVHSPNGNSTAQKFGYNGIELEESLGLNLMEMDLRSYDPAIARWTSIDPVIHHSMSTYTAFDNNPVYWADPSGADSIYNFDTGQYVINGQEVSEETAIAYAKNGGNANGNNNNSVDDTVYSLSKNNAQSLADDLNRIYDVAYGETPFSVSETTITQGGATFKGFSLRGSDKFDWNRDDYTKMLKGAIDADVNLLARIINDKGNHYTKYINKNKNAKGMMADYEGGFTNSPVEMVLSRALSKFRKGYKGEHTLGGVFLHELFWHIHPSGGVDGNADTMRSFYKLKEIPNNDEPRYMFKHKSNVNYGIPPIKY